MSTNSNVANLSITVVKTLVKMAGFGRVADMIDGGQECLNLLADIKNDALGDPNAEMIRSLKGSVRSELNAIQDALEQDGLNKKQSKQALAQLSEAARETIKNLAEDDNALIRAVQQPQCFAEQVRGHAAPLPDYSSDEMHTHYETLLDRLSLACCAVSHPYQNASTVLNSRSMRGSTVCVKMLLRTTKTSRTT